MEKLIYLLWKPRSQAEDPFKRTLLDEVAPHLLKLPIERLRVSVIDEDVARGAALRIGQSDPSNAGLITFWMEQSQDRAVAEEVIAPACDRIAGYLVVESRPLVNTEHTSPRGERTPGFTLVTSINKRPDISREEFLRVWYEEQRPCAIETQSTYQYVRNEVVRPLTPDGPAFDALVEETFPIGALTDPQVFYDAVGDGDKLEQNRSRMMKTCERFLDFSRIESHPMSEYDF